MSLRSELHEAYDELGPPPAGLSERVVMTAQRDLPRRGAWSLRLRAPLSLVAVFVVIAVVAGALVGGRIIADWKRFAPPPVPAVPQTPLQKLEARPLHLQTVRSVHDCPYGPFDADGADGKGPLHLAPSAVSPQTSWGTYFESLLWADGPVNGPVLVRVYDVLKHEPIVFIDQYADGPVVGTDVLNGRLVVQHAEFVIDPVVPPYSWQFTAGSAGAATPFCEGWQVDGPGFSEVFYAFGN